MICKQKLRHFHALTFVDENHRPSQAGGKGTIKYEKNELSCKVKKIILNA